MNKDKRAREDRRPTMEAVRREAMAFAGIGWFAFGFDGRVRAMDDGAFRLFDLAGEYPNPEAVVGVRIEELVHYSGEGMLRQKLRAAGRVRGVEWQFTTRAGAERWVMQNAYLVADPASRDDSIQVVLRDVTEARSAQQALRRTEAWLWAASEGSHDAFFVLRAQRGPDGALVDFTFEEANQRAEAYFGLERDLLLGQPLCVLFPAYREEGVFQKYVSVADTRMFLEEEFPAPLRDHPDRWLREQVLAVDDGVAVTSKDISDRRRMEEILRARERRLRLLLEHTPAPVAMLDREFRYVAHSPRWVVDFGIGATSLVGLGHFEVFHELPDRWRALLQRCLAGESARADAERLPRPDGVPEWVRYEVLPWGEREGEADGVVIFMEVITERVLAEQRLRESEERLRLALRGARMGTWEWDIETGEVVWSTEMAILCGVDPVAFPGTFAAFEAAIHPEDREPFRAALEYLLLFSEKDAARLNIEHRVIRPDGSVVWLEATGELFQDRAAQPARIVAVARDVTRRRTEEANRQSIERQLQHTQRLESLGVLAGGIAHDFNNLLTGVLGNVELLRNAPNQPPAAARRLEHIAQSAGRAAELCRQMLAYAGRGEVQIQRVNLNTLVSEMAGLLEVTLSKKAAFALDLAPALPDLVCDPGQIRQVIMNLVANASEALGAEHGRIELATGLCHADAHGFTHAQINAVESAGPFVRIEVRDSGPGIPEDLHGRIFEPFFTTKFAGRGLGLASVLGIVTAHHGALRVGRAPDGGAAFTAYLPACAEGQTDAARATAVLLVDDEQSILTVMAEYLTATDCAVQTAMDGDEGVRVFLEAPSAYDVVVLDRTMPCMGGEEAFRRIRAARPDIPVILTSGHTDDHLGELFPGLDAFVQKPFQGSELRAKIRTILGR